MKGIVTEAVGGFFYVVDDEGQKHRCEVRGRVQEQIFPGDRVVFENRMIEEIIPRDNLLYRPKVANVNAVNIMFSIKEPEIDFSLLDRFILLVEKEGLNPVILINKLDLDPDFPSKKEDKITAYKDAGYSVHIFSVKERTNLQALKESLFAGINVMAGPSGVGKSALINELVSGAELTVGEISEKLGRGTHTTRQVKLVPFSGDGWVADSPGFTSLTLENLDPEEVKNYFPDFSGYQNKCHFSTCTHTHEPDCFVKESVENDRIPEFRYNSYCQLVEAARKEGDDHYS